MPKKNNIINKIRNWIDTLETHSVIGEPLESYNVWTVHAGDESYYIKSSANDLIDKIYAELSLLVPGISSYDIHSLIDRSIRLKLFNKKEFDDDSIVKELDNIKSEIRQRECCLAVYGLETEEAFIIGNVEFHPKSLENQAPPLSKKDSEGVENNKYSWACVSLEGSQLYVDEASEIIVNEHIKTLEYLYHYIEDGHPSDRSLHMSSIIRGQETSMKMSRLKGGIFSNSISYNNRFGINITKDAWTRISSNALFAKLNSILKEDNKLSGKVLTAISFYHETVNENDPGIKTLKSIIGLEALFQTRKDVDESRISSNLAEKIAFLLSDEINVRLEVVNAIKKLYNTRSKVGHGAQAVNTDEVEAIEAQMYLGKTIAKFIGLYGEENGFSSIQDIDSWYELKKLS